MTDKIEFSQDVLESFEASLKEPLAELGQETSSVTDLTTNDKISNHFESFVEPGKDFHETIKPILPWEGRKLVDKRQKSGRFAAVFPALLTDKSKYAKEEEYIARMIIRDKKVNWG